MNFTLGAAKVLLTIIFLFLGVCVFRVNVFSQINKKSNSRIIKKNDSKSLPAGKYGEETERDELKILNLVNAERVKYRLNQLTWDEDAARIAFDYSVKMARENFFSHFDSNGQSVLERARNAGLKHWSKIGENLFWVESIKNFDSFAVKNWMKSPAHRQNILNNEWTTSGIGIFRSRTGEIFITQIFIKR